MITERDLGVLRAIAHYYVLSRVQLQRLCFPDDASGRITRRRLQTLIDAKLLNRTATPVFNPAGGSAWPAYFPARKGLEYLAELTGEERFLGVASQPPQVHHLLHWLAVSETHLRLDLALAAQSIVQCPSWWNEWDTVCPTETLPEKRYRIYTLLQAQPRLICAPDAAFLLQVGEHRKVFYLEQDRQTSGVRQVAAGKCGGYAAMLEQQGHLRHFPQATVPGFTVLVIAPNERRRDALRLAFRDKPAADCLKFASVADLEPTRLLHAAIFYPCQGEPVPLVRATESASARDSHNTQPTKQNNVVGRLPSTVQGECRPPEAAS